MGWIKEQCVMKKVAIITITNSGLNFGNRLQNYALQEKLKEYGVEVETIVSAKSFLNSIFISWLRRMVKNNVKRSRRRKFFEEFNMKYVKSSNRTRYEKLNEEAFAKEYDAFISGSDQVWNPNFHFNSEFEFMTFAEPVKRYSYAASFGVDSIPEPYTENYKTWLGQMRKISVRELKGKDIVKDLAGKDALVHIDPTMLLTKEQYIHIEERPLQKLPERYLLVYFLGHKTSEYNSFINKVAEKEGLELIELSELSDNEFYDIGPQHFIYLFRHAKYICTDSFHGTVFSIIFEKRFTVFYRQSKEVPMNNRIQTVLDKMWLSERLFGKLTSEESMAEMDYREVNRRIEAEKKEAENYLGEISKLW